MANLKERREQEDAWQAFADRIGCDLDDVKVQTNAALITDKRDKKQKAALPAWLRERIETTWRDKDKPEIKAVSNG